MLFQNPDNAALVRPADPVFAGSLTAASRRGGRDDLFDVLRREVTVIDAGAACYRLRAPALATFYPRLDSGSGRVNVSPSPVSVVGFGATFEEAWEDWAGQFHTRFQTLLAKRPWEMDEAERADWQGIERMIDVPAYRRETPYRIRQIGTVSQYRPTRYEPRPRPNQIRWESGKVENIRLTLAPPEFASFLAGRRFEAVVLRDPTTHELLRILDVIPLPALPRIAERDELWDSVPTTRDLPGEDWEKYD